MVLGQSLREAEAGHRHTPSPAQLEHVSWGRRLAMTADCKLGSPLCGSQPVNGRVSSHAGASNSDKALASMLSDMWADDGRANMLGQSRAP